MRIDKHWQRKETETLADLRIAKYKPVIATLDNYGKHVAVSNASAITLAGSFACEQMLTVEISVADLPLLREIVAKLEAGLQYSEELAKQEQGQ